MLEYLVTYNISVTDIYIEVIPDIKCKLHICHLEAISYNNNIKINTENYVYIFVPILMLSYLFGQKMTPKIQS